MHAADKKLNEMNRLSDMAHFPVSVNAGATFNVLLTISLTWWIQPHYPQIYAPIFWVAIVLIVNILPVLLLRLTLRSDEQSRRLNEMDFFKDQHRFSDLVYLAASANMAFWILVSWSVFSIAHSTAALLAMLVAAFLLTFSPVLLRGTRK